MQARLIAYPPEQAAIDYPLDAGGAVCVGRAEESALRIDHPSISRTHAELSAANGGWQLRDLGSKNGSFVDGVRVDIATLPRPCWLRLGDVYCEFALLDAAQAAAANATIRERRASAAAHTARLDGLQRLDELLAASLRGVVELAQCERGFLLLADGAHFAVCSALSLDPQRLVAKEFSGSIGAVTRALEQRHSVIANDIGSDPWLSGRASVLAAGLRSLVCLPLLDAERVIGAVYADRVRPGPAITTLDRELLEAFAETASLWIATRRGSELLERALADWDGIVDAHGKAA